MTRPMEGKSDQMKSTDSLDVLLRDLRRILAARFTDQGEIRSLCAYAGIALGRIDWTGNAEIVWLRVLDLVAAHGSGATVGLMSELIGYRPGDAELRAAAEAVIAAWEGGPIPGAPPGPSTRTAQTAGSGERSSSADAHVPTMGTDHAGGPHLAPGPPATASGDSTSPAEQASGHPTSPGEPRSGLPPSFELKAQPWYDLPLPRIDEPDAPVIEKLLSAAWVLVMTSTELDLVTLLRRLEPLRRRSAVLKCFHGQECYYLGRLGKHRVALTRSEHGAATRDGSMLTAGAALERWHPLALINVGTAWGRSPQSQSIGDVVIATKVVVGEARVGPGAAFPERIGFSGVIAEAGGVLLNRFRNVVGWEFRGPAGRSVRRHYGAVIALGQEAPDSALCADVFSRQPQAIALENEGAGIYAAAARAGTEWLMVKGLSAFACAPHGEAERAFASSSATSLLTHVLHHRGALEGLRRR